jgi:hypothetical protein
MPEPSSTTQRVRPPGSAVNTIAAARESSEFATISLTIVSSREPG